MFKILLLVLASAFIFLWGGCQSGGTDNTANWIGVYTSPNPSDTFTNLIITKSGNNSLRIEIKAMQGGYIYIYTTLQNVTVTNMTQSVINEHTNITGGTGSYDIQGSLILTGRNITLSATATGPADTKQLSFSGDKPH